MNYNNSNCFVHIQLLASFVSSVYFYSHFERFFGRKTESNANVVNSYYTPPLRNWQYPFLVIRLMIMSFLLCDSWHIAHVIWLDNSLLLPDSCSFFTLVTWLLSLDISFKNQISDCRLAACMEWMRRDSKKVDVLIICITHTVKSEFAGHRGFILEFLTQTSRAPLPVEDRATFLLIDSHNF